MLPLFLLHRIFVNLCKKFKLNAFYLIFTYLCLAIGGLLLYNKLYKQRNSEKRRY